VTSAMPPGSRPLSSTPGPRPELGRPPPPPQRYRRRFIYALEERRASWRIRFVLRSLNSCRPECVQSRDQMIPNMSTRSSTH
jgi:hypothetical protein